MRTTAEIQSAMVAYLKLQASVTTLLGGSDEIRELEWQGSTFSYPAIRVSIDLIPSVNGCGPDKADFVLDVFSEEKSSQQTSKISGALTKLLHKKAFIQNGLKFYIVIVTRVTKPSRSIYAWNSKVMVTTWVV